MNALNISHTSFVEEVKLKEKKDDKYELYVYYKGEPIAEEYQANRQKKHIEKILKGKFQSSLQNLKIHMIFLDYTTIKTK